MNLGRLQKLARVVSPFSKKDCPVVFFHYCGQFAGWLECRQIIFQPGLIAWLNSLPNHPKKIVAGQPKWLAQTFFAGLRCGKRFHALACQAAATI